MALASGFAEIRSVELSKDLHAKAVKRYAGRGNVRLYCGTSEDQLAAMIADLREPATFWLDAHYSAGITAKGPENSPVIKELRIIGAHPIKTHTILIDDRRQVGTADFDFTTEEQIRSAILAINPAYVISYDTGSTDRPIFKDDIIVARVA
jgi:hypothetical protein